MISYLLNEKHTFMPTPLMQQKREQKRLKITPDFFSRGNTLNPKDGTEKNARAYTREKDESVTVKEGLVKRVYKR